MISKLNAMAVATVLGLTLSFVGFGAKADLITNGSFSTLTNGKGQLGYNTNATGWTTSGYNFAYTSGSADTTGANGQYGNVKLWGPNDGSSNGFPVSSPDGGNFVAADGAFGVGAISQTVTGLTAGKQYTVSFWWAGAQQYGFDGATTEQWIVSLGSQQLATNIVNDVSHGFTGWVKTSLTFTADGASDLLSFVAAGTPAGVPPFSLLDGVTMSEVATVPEPTSAAILLTGLIGIGLLVRRRQLTRAARLAA